MKESIYTIPISEVFEPREGCPLCRLHKTLEERWIDYITGAAMMEPDVRQETNRLGFCGDHFAMMLEGHNRLSVALMIQSRLEYLGETLSQTQKRSLFGKKSQAVEQDGCFVCDRIHREQARIAHNIAALWARDGEFRALFAGQEFLCLPHYHLLSTAAGSLRGREGEEFQSAAAALTRNRMNTAKADIDAFCSLFDYRNAGAAPPSEEVSGAIEAAIAYLTGGSQHGA